MEIEKNTKKRKNPFQGKLELIVIMGILVSFAFVVGITLFTIGAGLVDEADARYQVVTDNVAEQITTWFSNEAQIVLNQKASLEIINDFEPDYLTEYLTRIVEDYNEEQYIYDLYFVNTDNVMSSGYGYIPDASIDFRERIWYVEALQKDGLYFSSPYKDSNLDRYVVTISTTCYKKDGTLAGVLALDIFVDTLFSIANNKALDGNSYVFLIDNNMGIATHPNEAFGYVGEEPRLLSSIPKNIYQKVETAINMRSAKRMNQSHLGIMDYDGVHRFFYVSKIECCGWYTVTAIQSLVLFVPLVKTLLIVSLALAVCLSAGIFITRIISSRMINQLNAANEAARAANETKSIFLANMSHEIRTPINAIIGMNEMVIRENKDPVINDYALDIASASRSLITIVNDILDFSKIESGKMEIIEAEFNIGSVINDIVNMSESRLGNKNLTLLFQINPDIPAGIYGDEMRIKQVILNMMTNAIKYTQSGFVSLRVDFTRQEAGIWLSVYVKDSGIGIAEENIDRLYESFQRFDSKRNRSIEGTGLGLSITKKLIENMGGFIHVESKLGEGSEFSFSLPLKVMNPEPFVRVEQADSIRMAVLLSDISEEDKIREQRVNEEREKTIESIREGLKIAIERAKEIDELKEILKNPEVSHIMTDYTIFAEQEEFFTSVSDTYTVMVLQKRGCCNELPEGIHTLFLPVYSVSLAAFLNHKKQNEYISPTNHIHFTAPTAKILIVDDNAMNLKVAAGLMKPYGMLVTTIDSGRKAIDILSSDPTYDIVFMDHMMPEMDGIEATAQIRNLQGDYYKNLVIVALTANTINQAKKMFLHSGFNDFLAKPINISSLDRILRVYIPDCKLNFSKEEDAVEHTFTQIADHSKQSKTVLFEPDVAMKYAGGSEELFHDILKEYVDNSDEMKDFIRNAFDNRDWKNYVIKVHALKSMSKTIGANPLSDLAFELEQSGKAGKTEPIYEKTELLFEQYEEVLSLVRNYLTEKHIDYEKAEESSLEIPDDLDSGNREEINEICEKMLEALSEFDSDGVEEIYEKYCKGDERYRKLFQKVVILCEDFMYEQATDMIGEIKKYEKNSND